MPETDPAETEKVAPPTDKPLPTRIKSLEDEFAQIKEAVDVLKKDPQARTTHNQIRAAWGKVSIGCSMLFAAAAVVKLFLLDHPPENSGLEWTISRGLAILAAFAFAYALLRTGAQLFLSEESTVDMHARKDKEPITHDNNAAVELVRAIGDTAKEIVSVTKKKE